MRFFTPLRPFAVAAALAIPLGLAGCDLEFPDQEVVFRLDAAADALDVFMTYRGVTAHDDSEEAIGKAVSAATTILAGRREFMFLDWPFHFDLDGGDIAAETEPAARRLVDAISIEKVGAFFDEEGRLSGYQHIRVSEASHLFRFLNDAISRAVLEADESGTFGSDAPWLDERSRALMVERARSGKPWLKLGASGFEIDFPVTTACASGALRELGKGNELFDGAVLSVLRYLKVGAERTVARFGDPVRGGGVRLSLHRDDVTYSPALQSALIERSLIDPARYDGVRHRFNGR